MPDRLLIDADDTLWENDRYYRAATARLTALLAGLGVDPARVQPLVDHYEQRHIASGGFGPTSFTAALVDTYRHLLRELGHTPDAAGEAEVRACAERLFDPRVELFADVPQTLAALSTRCTLVLVTKGEEQFQLAKLAGSGLAPYFEHARVLRHKDAAAYRDLVAELRLDPAETWMVGNSPRSDINPALSAGLGAVYIPSPHTWAQELEPLAESPRLCQLRRFAELAGLFQ